MGHAQAVNCRFTEILRKGIKDGLVTLPQYSLLTDIMLELETSNKTRPKTRALLQFGKTVLFRTI